MQIFLLEFYVMIFEEALDNPKEALGDSKEALQTSKEGLDESILCTGQICAFLNDNLSPTFSRFPPVFPPLFAQSIELGKKWRGIGEELGRNWGGNGGVCSLEADLNTHLCTFSYRAKYKEELQFFQSDSWRRDKNVCRKPGCGVMMQKKEHTLERICSFLYPDRG